MRVVLLAALVLALVVPHTVHAQGAPARPDDVLSIRTPSGAIVLVWTPVPEATGYVIYRGTSLVALQPIEVVSTSFYLDLTPHPGVVWYGVASTDGVNTSQPHNTNTGQDGEACVENNGGKVWVNAGSCVSTGGG